MKPVATPRDDVLSGGVLFAVAVAYGVGAWGLADGTDRGPVLLPAALAVCLALFSARIAHSGWRRRTDGAPPRGSGGTLGRRTTAAVGATAAYALLFVPLGFLIATVAYTAAMSKVFRAGPRARWLLPPLVTLLLHLFFRTALGVRLPSGLLG